MTKIVNSLSAKMEMGSPMACMYLLGDPDHYTNHLFSPFYWQAFVHEARGPWDNKKLEAGTSEAVGESTANEDPGKQLLDKVTLLKCNGCVIGLYPVHDYVFCPIELENLSLYDWISRYQQEKKTPKKLNKSMDVHLEDDSDIGVESDSSPFDPQEKQESKNVKKSKSTLLSFLGNHPLAETHGACKLKKVRIPNFVGQTLPRCDQGDCEYYCSVMCVLYTPPGCPVRLQSDSASLVDIHQTLVICTGLCWMSGDCLVIVR